MTKGKYERDFYIIPTILIHHSDCYTSVELAWLKWYIGIVFNERRKKYIFEGEQKGKQGVEVKKRRAD